MNIISPDAQIFGDHLDMRNVFTELNNKRPKGIHLDSPRNGKPDFIQILYLLTIFEVIVCYIVMTVTI